MPSNPNKQHSSSSGGWGGDIDHDHEPRQMRGSAANKSSGSLQPPPAHQHHPLTRSTSTSSNAPSEHRPIAYNKPQIIPGTSSTLTPIDLSSSLPSKALGMGGMGMGGMSMADMMSAAPIDLSEVQDFSMSKSKASSSSGSPFGSGGGKGKLDDMLTKLMKKNNCVSVGFKLLSIIEKCIPEWFSLLQNFSV